MKVFADVRVRRKMKAVILSIACLALISPAMSSDQEGGGASVGVETAKGRLTQLFQALGGRKAWEEGVVDYEIATVTVSPERAPILFEFWFHLHEPRTITRVRGTDSEQIRIYNGEQGWTLKRNTDSSFNVETWSEARMKRERQDWNSNFAVQIARAARREVAVSVVPSGVDRAGWLRFSAEKEDLLYIETDPDDGVPTAFFQVDFSEQPTLLDPPVQGVNFKIPSGGKSGGVIPFTIHHARLVTDPDEIEFTLEWAESLISGGVND